MRAAVLAFLLVVGGTSVSATTASAAPPVDCVTKAYLPTTNGTYTYARSTLTCAPNFGLLASAVKSQVQESVLAVWVSRGTAATNGSAGLSNTVTQSYNCNGHGTDNWRTRGDGTDNYSRATSDISSLVSLTC